MNEVYVSTRYTAECYPCGWVSQPMVDMREAEAEGRRHVCPQTTDPAATPEPEGER